MGYSKIIIAAIILVALAFAAGAEPLLEGASVYYGGEIPGPNNLLLLGPLYFYSSPATAEAKLLAQVPSSEAVVPAEVSTSVPTTTIVSTTTTSIVPTTLAAISTSVTTTTTYAAPTSTTTTTTTSTTTTTLIPEAKPQISIWFDNRLYQPALADKFIVSSKPKIKLVIRIEHPYALSIKNQNYAISVDNASVQGFSMQTAQVTNKIAAAGVKDGYSEIVFEYPLTENLVAGEHVFDFSAKSAGNIGIPANVNISAKVLVASGELKLMDTPITFPSPYSPTRDKDGITLQYTLSSNADIEIYIFSISGELVKKISCSSGSEGGNAGLNKVTWDGRLDSGAIAGNGIYLGTIVAKNEGKKLAKIKINVFD